MSNSDPLREELLQTDDEYRRLYEEHQECERRLEELNSKSFLSQQDEMEEKQLKRQKLSLKDRMAHLERSHREAQLTV